MFNSSLARSVGSSVLGFLVYGAWAAFANRAYGAEVMRDAWLTQGSFSFVMTLVLTLLMEWLYRKTGWVALTTGLVSIFVISASYTVNWLAGTPEIIITILPGAIISGLFAYFYILGLKRFSGDSGKPETRS